MHNPLQFAYTYRNILLMPQSDEIKRKVLKTYILLSCTNQAKRKPINVTGFKVNYCNYNLLKLLFNEIFVGNEYLFSSNTLKPTIIDCGSNIGMSVLYFNLIYPDCNILAFEPDEETFSILEANIKQNHLDNVILHKKALSKSDGTLDFYYDQKKPGSLTMSAIKARIPKQNKTVVSTRLSHYIDNNIDFLKLDIEGLETEVIEDLRKENKIHLIERMVIEYHHHIEKDIDGLSIILAILEESNFGYQIEGSMSRPWKPFGFQDLLIYAYRK